MARKFVYDGREFPDPDPQMTADAVRQQLTNYFPELANADTAETKVGDDTIHTFSRRIGTKGVDTRDSDGHIPSIHHQVRSALGGEPSDAQRDEITRLALDNIRQWIAEAAVLLAEYDVSLSSVGSSPSDPLRFRIANLLAQAIPGYERPTT